MSVHPRFPFRAKPAWGSSLAAVMLIVMAPATAVAATITLFQNDFEAPTGILIPSGCCSDATQQTVNSLFGTAFDQTFTVETLAINGPAEVYSDPSGIGGNYALGMLTSEQNDLLSLTFDTTGLGFVNLGWDIAAVGIDQPVGAPITATFLTGASSYRLTLYDTPGGTFSFASLGTYTVLDSKTVTGTDPLPGGLTFDWLRQVVALNASGQTDNQVTLVIDQIAGGYGAFDNLVIAASTEAGDLPGVVPEPSTLLLLGTGLALATRSRRRRR